MLAFVSILTLSLSLQKNDDAFVASEMIILIHAVGISESDVTNVTRSLEQAHKHVAP